MFSSIICRACGAIVLPGSGATVITIESPDRPARRMPCCADCALQILRRFRGSPAVELAGAGAGAE